MAGAHGIHTVADVLLLGGELMDSAGERVDGAALCGAAVADFHLDIDQALGQYRKVVDQKLIGFKQVLDAVPLFADLVEQVRELLPRRDLDPLKLGNGLKWAWFLAVWHVSPTTTLGGKHQDSVNPSQWA